eukprot:2322354-Lingulodinium_polyedra.AAC.1
MEVSPSNSSASHRQVLPKWITNSQRDGWRHAVYAASASTGLAASTHVRVLGPMSVAGASSSAARACRSGQGSSWG